MTLRKWLKEPLLHFLLAGGLMFALVGWLTPEDETGLTITIGKEDLLGQLQTRAQLYDRESFTALLDGMSEAERTELVRETALTEALWREGQALGLADADPLVRARVIQQMRQLVMDEAAADVSVSGEQAKQFYEANRERYAVGSLVSFTHVFLSTERRGDMARADATALLRDLREAKVGTDEAGAYGDRFLYQRNYSEAGMREISSQFGDDFARALFALQPGGWQGPLRSDYGWHLVYLTALEPANVPEFDAIAERVRDDAEAEERSRLAAQALDRLLDRYSVVER